MPVAVAGGNDDNCNPIHLEVSKLGKLVLDVLYVVALPTSIGFKMVPRDH